MPPVGVARERTEVERLGNDALAGEGGVAMDHDGQRRRRVMVGIASAALGLLRPRAPVDHGPHELEVARVAAPG